MSEGGFDATELALAARRASRSLQSLSSEARTTVLNRVAEELVRNEGAILAENASDMLAAEESGVEPQLLNRLKLKDGKIAQLAEGIRSLAKMEEPVGRCLRNTRIADGLHLKQVTSPLGVLMVIFESRPDALPQIASLALRSGNGLLLKGGKEAAKSNAILHRVITQALAPEVDPGLIGLVTTREGIDDLLKLHHVIDLVIPRGSNQLVSYIQKNTQIPVMGHADGVCHVYVDSACDLAKATHVVVDSKVDYPAACNALETLLIHQDLVTLGKAKIILDALTAAGVELFAGPRATAELGLPACVNMKHEYGTLACSVEIVENLKGAIDHIHKWGSSHTECILTEDQATADLFLSQVDSACVFHNTSTRFSDGFRFGLGAEVGVSTGRIHARGPVGVDGLLTTRWIMRGSGHVVEKDANIKYLHQKLPLTE
mmetsp:Transcript_1406/g.2003  ORF Transcript_1406/g.2003 Transcript_1406/m.2003 type:complete len:431 (-) Transcript_1406:220-1512(-)|eukprot:CAMPEP_0196584772 /NCGR_PEP_ID=MMETSP1081-20130531/48421_1 /TAXON_ID=36882 /ORGANISM="Pyramimonas amylifera, Strain CCMP720" /LENGTH=430 /DNA_ID=CAMNT_0041906109 /DNA_START=135 /DNA_END=1427 /DNA_ORIENTATION=+